MLGHYTHFGNLLDLCAVAVPAGITADGRPASVMVLGPALADDTVLHLAAQILDEPRSRLPTRPVIAPSHRRAEERLMSRPSTVPAEPSPVPARSRARPR